MSIHAFGLLTLTSTCLLTLTSATWTYEGTTVTLALVNYTYRDPRRDGIQVEVGQIGKYAPGQAYSGSGQVVVAPGKKLAGNLNAMDDDNCVFPWSSHAHVHAHAPTGPWVALVGKGRCADDVVVSAAVRNNASAVIMFTRDEHAHLRKIGDHYPGVGVVWLGEEEGRGLAGVVEGGAEVVITLVPGHNLRYHVTSVNRTSVLFVSVSFIILMAISLAWLVFYYVQRFRYIHAKDRLERHLCNAAKKALAKIPVKNLKALDREITMEGECCAVCIEHYQVGEAIRTLPCKHQFHRCCVDPWLLEHRTCPMCKMDILKHYGYVLSESEESVLQLDMGDGGEGGQGGAVGGFSGTETTPTGPHTSRTAPHFTPIVMVSRSDGGGGGGWQEGAMGIDRLIPDIPISPTHTPMSYSPQTSLLSFQSPSCKSLSPSLSSSTTLGKIAPSPPPLQKKGDTQESPHHHHHSSEAATEDMDLEVSSVCSGQCSANASRASTPVLATPTPQSVQTPAESPLTPSAHPSPPTRSKRRSQTELTPPNEPPTPTFLPAAHVVSVSHF